MKYTKELKGIAKILLLALTIILLFTFIFYLFDYTHFNGMDEKHDDDKLFHRFYFTITTLSSAGYGDITPKTMPVKIISSILQFILIISLMSGFVTLCE